MWNGPFFVPKKIMMMVVETGGCEVSQIFDEVWGLIYNGYVENGSKSSHEKGFELNWPQG